MAQSCYFVTVDGELYEEVLVHKPCRNDLIGICMDMALIIRIRLTPWM